MFPAFLWNGSVFVGVGKRCLCLDVFQVSYAVQLSLQYNWSFSWHFVPYHKKTQTKIQSGNADLPNLDQEVENKQVM